MWTLHIIHSLQQLKVMAGKLPKVLYTDFDTKLLSKQIVNWYAGNNGAIFAAPPEQQHQNGLVERTWQTLSNMARAFINDKQMPRSFWYWAIKHDSRTHNIFPIKFHNKLMTPHELIYKSQLMEEWEANPFSTLVFILS